MTNIANRTRAKVGKEAGLAYNLQGNKSDELKKTDKKLQKKLNPPSAKAWYIKNGGEWPPMCTVKLCQNLTSQPNGATDGAHVFLDGDQHSVYILPTCRACNVCQIEIEYIGFPLFLCKLTDAELSTLKETNARSVELGYSRDKPRRSARIAELAKRAAAKLSKQAPAEQPVGAQSGNPDTDTSARNEEIERTKNGRLLCPVLTLKKKPCKKYKDTCPYHRKK